ncbi:23943_t:CDS:2, partial [Entrophospora sp. SA101]
KMTKRKKKAQQEDFKKQKLKVGKAKPKASNFTNTSFKSRAISLPNQSITEDKSNLITNTRKLSLSELLTQLRHYNSRTRKAINTAIAKEKIGAIPGFFVGGVAACGAVTFTNPWEVVKTRLQLQGELARGNSNYIKPYTNVFQAFSMIVRREGLRGIQKGIGPAYVYQLVMNGSRLGFYDPIRNSLIGFLNVSNTSMPISILSGGLAGVIGAALGSPFYLVKTRMQSHSQHIMAVGHQHSYKNTFDALKQISKKGGIKDLFRGVDAAMLRTGVGSATQLSSYFYIKRWTIQETGLTDSDILVHVFSSLLSGLCVCTAMNPFDVISTRILYKNTLDCFIKTVRTEGIFGLYKGFVAHYFRIG